MTDSNPKNTNKIIKNQWIKNAFYVYLSGFSSYVVIDTYKDGYKALIEARKNLEARKGVYKLEKKEYNDFIYRKIYQACNKDMSLRVSRGIFWPYQMTAWILPYTIYSLSRFIK